MWWEGAEPGQPSLFQSVFGAKGSSGAAWRSGSHPQHPLLSVKSQEKTCKHQSKTLASPENQFQVAATTSCECRQRREKALQYRDTGCPEGLSWTTICSWAPGRTHCPGEPSGPTGSSLESGATVGPDAASGSEYRLGHLHR